MQGTSQFFGQSEGSTQSTYIRRNPVMYQISAYTDNLIFWPNLLKKRISSRELKKGNITIEFCIFELALHQIYT